MTRLAAIVALLGSLLGCTGRLVLPVLSCHAVATLRQRQVEAQRRRSQDFSVNVVFSWATTRGRQPQPLETGRDLGLPPSAAYEQAACAHAALCEWAWSAELATLVALGVAP